MKLKNIILPLSFLGLAPGAKAQTAPENQNNSIQNKNIELIQTPTQNIADTTKTIHFNEVQKNDSVINDIVTRLTTPKFVTPDTTATINLNNTLNLRPVVVDEELESEDLIAPLVKNYNKNPEAYDFNKIYQLLNLMPDPRDLYEQLEIPIRHAIILTDEITPELLEKLDIVDKNDILMTSIEKKPEALTDQEAFNFIADGNIVRVIKKPERIIEKSLKIALQNLDSIHTNQRQFDCISNIMDYTLLHQDSPEMARLYMEIFIATTNIIRQYDANKDQKNIHLESINKLSLAIEQFNRNIIHNSVLDQEIIIKSPRDFVLNEYQDITHRVNLTKIYNEAYYTFLTNRYKANRQRFNNPAIQKLFSDYIDAIELLTRARNKKLTEQQHKQLNELTQRYPEIKLFDPYFSNIYINTTSYDQFLSFITSIHAAKSNKPQKIPTEILSMLGTCQQQANSYRSILKGYSINLPEIQFAPSRKISYSDAVSGPLNPYEIFKKIDSTLYQQARALTFQHKALQRLAKIGGWSKDSQHIAMLKSR